MTWYVDHTSQGFPGIITDITWGPWSYTPDKGPNKGVEQTKTGVTIQLKSPKDNKPWEYPIQLSAGDPAKLTQSADGQYRINPQSNAGIFGDRLVALGIPANKPGFDEKILIGRHFTFLNEDIGEGEFSRKVTLPHTLYNAEGEVEATVFDKLEVGGSEATGETASPVAIAPEAIAAVQEVMAGLEGPANVNDIVKALLANNQSAHVPGITDILAAGCEAGTFFISDENGTEVFAVA